MLIKTENLPGSSYYGSQMAMNTSTENIDNSLARKFQKIFQTQHGHMTCWITLSTENMPVNGCGLNVSMISNTANMFHTHQLKRYVI